MADETEQLFEAATALDVRLSGTTPKAESGSVVDADDIPEDATEVPDSRDLTATRNGSSGAQSEGA